MATGLKKRNAGSEILGSFGEFLETVDSGLIFLISHGLISHGIISHGVLTFTLLKISR